MEAYRDVAHLWDIQNPANFSQLPDDDFLAMLHKQYPSYPDAVNPQNISRYSISTGATPSSDDDSPSPPHSATNDDSHDPALKRKASDDGLEDDGPSQKTQHTRTSFLALIGAYIYQF